MHKRVTFPDAIEPLVQFVEETPCSEIIDRTLEKLRAGVPIQTMLTASALAVTRSSDLPPGHHGGPLHPVAGLYAITTLIERLGGEERILPVLQHVALANKHINDPVTSPYQLLKSEPLDAARASVRKAYGESRKMNRVSSASRLFRRNGLTPKARDEHASPLSECCVVRCEHRREKAFLLALGNVNIPKC